MAPRALGLEERQDTHRLTLTVEEAAQLLGISRAKAPSTYVHTLAEQSGAPPAMISERIRGHQIDYERLSADDFDGYFTARRRALLEVIGDAMEKDIIDVEVSVATVAQEYDVEDEEPGDSDVGEEVA